MNFLIFDKLAMIPNLIFFCFFFFIFFVLGRGRDLQHLVE